MSVEVGKQRTVGEEWAEGAAEGASNPPHPGARTNATGAGSARPVVSIRTWSKRLGRFISVVSALMRSPRTVQHTQLRRAAGRQYARRQQQQRTARPLSMEMTSSLAARFSDTSASSMFTSPNSFWWGGARVGGGGGGAGRGEASGGEAPRRPARPRASMTAMSLPCWPCRMLFTSVVLPAPRKPVTGGAV